MYISTVYVGLKGQVGVEEVIGDVINYVWHFCTYMYRLEFIYVAKYMTVMFIISPVTS